MKSEVLAEWPDAFAGLGLDDLLSNHVTLSADEMTLISQQIQLRMQQTQLQVCDVTLLLATKITTSVALNQSLTRFKAYIKTRPRNDLLFHLCVE